MGRREIARCVRSSQAVFWPIGRKGPVPASWPDPGTSAAMATAIVEALRAWLFTSSVPGRSIHRGGTRCRPKPAWRGLRLRSPRRSGDDGACLAVARSAKAGACQKGGSGSGSAVSSGMSAGGLSTGDIMTKRVSFFSVAMPRSTSSRFLSRSCICSEATSAL